MSGEGSGGPRRGYSWPPFEHGNTAALKHGAQSPRIISPIAERFSEELRTRAPWLSGDAFTTTIETWAWNKAQVYLIRLFIDEHGPLEIDGSARPVMALQSDLERQGARLDAELGLTPASSAKILRDLSALVGSSDPDVLKALRAEGARFVDARRKQLEAGSEGAA